jgi:RNA polymerase sigma factor (sigma-70 family)
MNAPAPEWNNAQLVEHCLRGDERAWNALVDRYKNLVYSIPLKYGAGPDDASDIFQSVWLDLFNELPKLRDAEALQGWLVRITVHKCYHWKKALPAATAELEEAEADGAGAVAPPGMLADVEREQLVRDAIAQLPPRCRQMVEMLFFEHPPLRYTEVAERLKIAPGSIGFIRGRCLKRLKAILEERGF